MAYRREIQSKSNKKAHCDFIAPVPNTNTESEVQPDVTGDTNIPLSSYVDCITRTTWNKAEQLRNHKKAWNKKQTKAFFHSYQNKLRTRELLSDRALKNHNNSDDGFNYNYENFEWGSFYGSIYDYLRYYS